MDMILVAEHAVVRSAATACENRARPFRVTADARTALRHQNVARLRALRRLGVTFLARQTAMRSVRELRVEPARWDHRRRGHRTSFVAAFDLVTEPALHFDDLLGVEQRALV